MTQPTLTSRRFFLTASLGLAAAACSRTGGATPQGPSPAGQAGTQGGNSASQSVQAMYADSPFRNITEDEWRERLSADAFDVMREEGTERPFSSPLNDETRDGVFACKGCELPLFAASTKYKSGTGWPSFFDHLPDAIATKPDNTLFMQRTEYHCARCLSHQGHVFDDGPRPTGLRYCNNGVALIFVPA